MKDEEKKPLLFNSALYVYDTIPHVVHVISKLDNGRFLVEVVGYARNPRLLRPPKQHHSIMPVSMQLEVEWDSLESMPIVLVYTTIERFCFHNAHMHRKLGKLDIAKLWEAIPLSFLPQINIDAKKI